MEANYELLSRTITNDRDIITNTKKKTTAEEKAVTHSNCHKRQSNRNRTFGGDKAEERKWDPGATGAPNRGGGVGKKPIR